MIITRNSLISLENPSRQAKKQIDLEGWIAFANSKIKLAKFSGDYALQIPAPDFSSNRVEAVGLIEDAGYNAALTEDGMEIYIEIF